MKLPPLDWNKVNGMMPIIVQHAQTGVVLMLGYMNPEALEQTMNTRRVTFFSRSKNRLWEKGETSGNFLNLISIHVDCDEDALLILAIPEGPTCHLGTESCFKATPPHFPSNTTFTHFIGELEHIIERRQKSEQNSLSYVAKLFASGMHKIAQKVGEEGVEVALAGVAQDDDALTNEAADLIFHLLVLLKARNLRFEDVISVLRQRKRDIENKG